MTLSPTEQAFLDNPEQFSNRKQRYLRYRIRKKLNVAAQQQQHRCGEREGEDSLVERYLGKVSGVVVNDDNNNNHLRKTRPTATYTQ
jgi:hypothetical protein